MSFVRLSTLLRDGPKEGPISALPYAQTLGLRYIKTDAGITIHMPFSDALIGAPKRLHGGTIAGLLEIASIAQVIHALGDDAAATTLKPVNVTVDYLRGGASEDSYAAAIITRIGRRIANIRAEAWQADRTRLIACAHMNVMIARRDAASAG